MPTHVSPTPLRRAGVLLAPRGIAATLIVAFAAPGAADQEAAPPPLFASDEPLVLTLAADLSLLERDRGEDAPWRPARVTLVGDAGDVSLPARLQTRGDFRRDPSNCSFPPLRIEVPGAAIRGSAFEGQDELKIVASCRPGRDSYEQYVLSEYLAYRIYSTVTDRSFRVRLARITFVDERGETRPTTRIAFFIEDDDALAARLGGRVFDLDDGKNLPIGAFDRIPAATTAVFQYMIGNTDWSEVAGHNVEIVDRGGVATPVPYDFDFSGLVDATYAVPAADVAIRSVRDRLYRGWCWAPPIPGLVLERFRGAEEQILELVRRFQPLDDSNRSRILGYLGRFFEEIESDARAERLFLRDCRAPTG